MANPFSHTLRALASDRLRAPAWAILAATCLGVAWTAWFLFSRVEVLETTKLARLEVAEEAHPVEAQVGGRVVSARLELGRDVTAGEVLVELDATREKLELAEERAKVEALTAQVEAIDAELAASELTGRDVSSSTRASQAEATARRREADAAAQLADDELARLERLAKSGNVPEADVSRARAQAQQRRAAADALRLEVKMLGSAGAVTAGDRRTQLERLRRERARIDGEIGAGKATGARLEHEIERRRIAAPVAGRLGAVQTLQGGMVLKEGDRLATILPSGDLKVVADYSPEQALGKIRAGQRARLRLDGFAWTEYGSLPATVTRVGSEARFGRVRVELKPQPPSGSRIPLTHGLPGALEIVVEEVSPATLVLRAVGEATASP